MINLSYQGNSVVNNSFNGVNSKKIKFTKMHCIFLSFYIILNIVHDNRKTLRIGKGASFVYTRDLKIRGRGARTAMGVDEED